jgi:hypothetical protein
MAQSLKMIAGDGVADRQGKEAKADGEHGKIEHGRSPCCPSDTAIRQAAIRKRWESEIGNIKKA